MRRNIFRKIFLSVVLCLSVLFSAAIAPAQDAFARTVSEIEEEQAELEAKKEEIDKKLEELQNDMDKQEEYLETLEKQQQNLQKQIDDLNLQITEFDTQILEIENQIADVRKNIAKKTEVLKERLKVIYMMGEASTLEILLNCDSLMDFSEKTEILQAISKHDLKLISELKKDVDAVADDIAVVEGYKETVLNNKTKVENKRAELGELYDETHRVMEEMGVTHEDLCGESYDIETQISENAAEIEELLTPPEPEVNEDYGGSFVGTGSFIWPCPGYTYLTSYWGDGRDHKGIDIAGGSIYGAPVVAADSGVVTWAVHEGWGGGYGLSVWIDHGNGYSTRYGHFSQTAVYEGEHVEQGQIIGYVGSTGDSSGPHLHYEIRNYEVPYDPMQWYS